MLTYILPVVVLLLIAIILVLKKRNQPQKSKAKETVSSSSKGEKAQTAEKQHKEDTATQKENEKQLQTIQGLMAQEHFNDAEALINQSLNRDHQQAHLYFLLLEIYQKQDNQLAINQLLNDLRTLQLFDTLRDIENQINAKKIADEKEAQQKAVQAAKEKQQAEKEKQQAEKERLEAEKLAAEREQAQKKVEPTPLVVPEQTLETEKTNTVEPVATQQPESEPKQTESTDKKESTRENPIVELEALDFSSDSTPHEKTEQEKTTPQQHDQDHILEFEFSPKPTSNTQDQPVIEDKKEQENPHLIDFEFTSSSTSSHEKETPVAQTTPTQNEPKTSHQTFELNFDEPAQAAPVVTQPDQPTEEVKPAVEADVLFLEFPELSEINENSLNIQLAKQYIEMGELMRAKDLLTEPNHAFSKVEQAEVDQLLNKIAS